MIAKKHVRVTPKNQVIIINGRQESIEVFDLPEQVAINDAFWQLRFVRLPDDLPISFPELKQALEIEGWTFDQFTTSENRNHPGSPTRRMPVFRRPWLGEN